MSKAKTTKMKTEKVTKAPRAYVTKEVKEKVIARTIEKSFQRGDDQFMKVLGDVGFLNKENTVIKRLPGSEDISLDGFNKSEYNIAPMVSEFEHGAVPLNKVARIFKKMSAHKLIDQKLVNAVMEEVKELHEEEADLENEVEVEELEEVETEA